MTYQGACPVTLKPGQPFVIVKPDGKVIDPFENTPCMVDVLRTVDGVTAPSIGFFQDPDFGPSPFVRYNYPGPDGRSAEVTFVAQGDLADPGKWAFVAQMSGLHGPGGPYVYGADKFMTPWHDRCHVETRILFP